MYVPLFTSLHAMSCLCTTVRYRVLLRKSGVKTPRIELEEIGPSFDLVLRRHQMAPSHLYKEACKVPRTVKVCLSSPSTLVSSNNTALVWCK